MLKKFLSAVCALVFAASASQSPAQDFPTRAVRMLVPNAPGSSIAPDVPVMRIMWGTIPYVICMFLAIVILCVFPEIATWLPDKLMGVARR